MINLFPRLPLGGKLLAKQGDEGQPNNNQAFSRQQAALYSTRVPGFPVGEAVGFCRLKRSLHVFPLPEKKFSKLHFFRQKLSAASRLPLACIKFRSLNFLRQKFEALPCVKASPQGGGSLQSKVVRGCSIFYRLLAFPFVNPCRVAA